MKFRVPCLLDRGCFYIGPPPSPFPRQKVEKLHCLFLSEFQLLQIFFFGVQYLDPESTPWNPESKTVLNSLT